MPFRAKLLAVAVPLLLLRVGPAGAQGPARAGPGVDPRAIVWSAVIAVEGDSAEALRARWEQRLARQPGDREAALGVATIDRLTTRYEAAERRYRALDRPVLTRDDPITAYARSGLAAIAQGRGDQRAAAAQYERAVAAARVVGDVAAEVHSQLGLARARSRLAGPVAALALLDSVAGKIPPGDLRLRATFGANRAGLLAQVGRPEARDVALECVDLARRAQAPRAEVACYLPLAMDAERRGDTRPAIELLDEVAERNRRAHDRWALANTLQWQGYLLSTRGEYGRARDALREAVAHGEASRNGVALAWAALRLARIARHAQDRAAATALVARSVAAFRAQGDVAGVMEAHELEVTLAADVGDYARARRLAAEQLAWGRTAGRPRLEFTALVAQAALAERERDWTTALAVLDTADAVMRRHGMTGWEDVLWYHQGLVALRRGDLATAERALRANLEVLDDRQHVFRYRTRARLADLYARRGELARAERELASAGAELDAWRTTLTDEELLVAAFQVTEDPDPDLGVPGVVATLAAGGRVESAFAIAERRRARALADQLARAAGVRQDKRGAAANPAALARGVSAGEIAAALPDSATALLEYVTGAGGAPTTLFVVTRAGGRPSIRTALLPPADSLAARVSRLATLLDAGADPRSLARGLGAALLDPAVAVLPPTVTRLVVVPDGPLHRAPFDALRLADGRFAVERFAVGVAPSAAVAAGLWRHPRAGSDAARPARVLALGDPAFAPGGGPGASDAEGEEGARYRAAFASAGGLPRLARSGREARVAASYADDAVVRLRGDASEAFLERARLTDFRVIHLATHALVDDRPGGHAALALAPGDGQSGFVAAGDLAALRLDADLVVLSACRTAGGVVVTGEGVQGLTAPLLQAGARAVVATGWRIDDGRAADFVADLYAALAEDRPVIDALRAAKLAALRRGVPPGEWAAFTVVGDPFARVPLRAPSPLPWWLAPTVATVAAAGGLAARRLLGPRPPA